MAKLLFLGADEGGGVREEVAAAAMAAEELGEMTPTVCCPETAARHVADEGGATVLWWHRPAPPGPELVAAMRPVVDALRRRGGRIFLSLGACAAVHALGLDDRPPDLVAEEYTDEIAPEFSKLGFAGFGPHPLFRGMPGWGNYLWSPRALEPYRVVAYGNGLEVGRRRVVGVEKSFLRTDPNKVLLWEYEEEEGRILCCGAHLVFGPTSRPNRYRANVMRFLENVFAYLRKPDLERARWWNVTAHAPGGGELGGLPSPPSAIPCPIEEGGPAGESDAEALSIEGPATAHTDFVLAGERLFVVGRDLGSIGEVWAHPNRVVRDLRCDLVLADGRELDVEGETETVLREPGFFRRRGTLEEAPWTQSVAVSSDEAWFAVDLDMDEAPGTLRMAFLVDFRRQWPFPERCWGAIDLRSSDDGRRVAFTVRKDGDVFTLACRSLGEGLAPDWRFEREGAGLRAVVDGKGPLRLAFWAGAVDPEKAVERLEELCRRHGVSGDAWRARARRRQAEDRARLVRVDMPDSVLQNGFDWACAGLRRFAGRTDELGRGMLGGYAATRPGWGDARPGYAWFFGRDTTWSVLGLLACGQVELARDGLAFLARQQAPDGKIPHEVTTSGAVQDDAADSTPLWVSAVAEYLRWTGDLAFVRDHRGDLERALRFCDSTVGNRDGWIENRGVGHGWVEFGVLGEARVSLYLASVWTAALRAAAYLASCLGEEAGEDALGGGADRLARRADAMRARLEQRFSWAGRESLCYGLDGDLDPVPIETVMPAIPAWLEQVPSAGIQGFLDVLAGPAFSTDWGVRLLPAHESHYNPRGYHTGAVWPLFSGWAAMAEFAQHRPLAAFQHASSIAAGHALPPYGLFEEAIAADVWAQVGVCRHHVWSAAMASASVMAGLLGARDVDAVAGRFGLEPHVPPAWDRLDVKRIRVGDRRLDLSMRRRGNVATWTFRLEGRPLECLFRPGFAGGTTVERLVVDGAEIPPVTVRHPACLHCEVPLVLRGETRVSITLGPLVAPLLEAEPARPGESSRQARWIRWTQDDEIWSARVAGRSGTRLVVPLTVLAMDPDELVAHGSELRLVRSDAGPRLEIDFGGDGEGWVTRGFRLTRGARDLPPEESGRAAVPF